MITESPIYKNIVKQSNNIIKELGAKDLDDALRILKERFEVDGNE